ncbi:MAG: hypothetical protein ABIP36_06250 [Acidimicrobiales bacterium]
MAAANGAAVTRLVTRRRRPASFVALVGMHAFEVGEHDLTVERVAMRDQCMLHHRVGDQVLVSAGEVEAAARAHL